MPHVSLTAARMDLCAMIYKSCAPSLKKTQQNASLAVPAPSPAPRRSSAGRSARWQPHAKPGSWHAQRGACSVLHSPPGTGTPCVPTPACPPGVSANTGMPFPALTNQKLRLSQKGLQQPW